MDGVTVDWIGTRALMLRIAKAGAKANLAAMAALYAEANRIMALSVRITPRDTGALRASGHVEGPTLTARGPEVEMGYGGSSAPYAVFVHEKLDAHHDVGQAKFLEQPVLEAANGLGQRLAATMRLSL